MNIEFAIAIALAFFLAWNLGANDVANAMGTSVGAGVVTLRQALILAGVMEFSGAILLGHGVTTTLVTGIAPLPLVGVDRWASMMAVLLANGLWLWIATLRGWPVASSHAAVSAIVGISLVWAGGSSLHWSTVGWIGLSWLCTPLFSGLISALYYGLMQHYLLTHPDVNDRIGHWQPWLSVSLVLLIGSLVLPTMAAPLSEFASTQWHWQLPHHDYTLALSVFAFGAIQLWVSSTPLKSENHNLSSVEARFGKFQLLSAGCMAFAHGSNDVGNAIAPLAVLFSTPNPLQPSDTIQVPVWMLVLGGLAIVGGLATLGQKVILTVGEKLIPLRPSIGFCAEIGAASTVLLASVFGLPVSTTHALIGSVVGVGLIQHSRLVQWSTVKEILAAWLLTIPITSGLAVILFRGLRLLLS